MLDKIYIPTLGRIHRQTTYNLLPEKYKKIAHLVVQPHEYEETCKLYPNVICLPEHVKGITNTRKWIIERATNSYYAMIDDDVEFLRRHVNRSTGKKPEGTKSKTPFTEQDFDDLFDVAVTKWFNNGVTVAGIEYYETFPAKKSERQFGMITQCFFIDGHKLPAEKLDWSLEYSEDHHFILQVLQLGLKTRLSDDFLRKNKVWTEGGCQAQGRTIDTDIAARQALVDAYPGIVEWTGKDRKHQNGHMEPTIRINWKKCYQQSQTKKLSNLDKNLEVSQSAH